MNRIVSRRLAFVLQGLPAVTILLVWPTGLKAQERAEGTHTTAKVAACWSSFATSPTDDHIVGRTEFRQR